jgi:tRNA U55 pseudouridine synthase TruB
VGRFDIKDSLTIDELNEAVEQGKAASVMLSIEDAIADLPSVVLAEQDLANAMHGCAVPAEGLNGECEAIRMLSPEGQLIAIGNAASSENGVIVKPRKVFVTAW